MLGKTIQSSKRQAPSYTVTGRSKIGSFHEDLQKVNLNLIIIIYKFLYLIIKKKKKTPGPGNYNIVNPGKYKNEQPHYSMLGRNNMPGDSTVKPGPGTHSPERVRYI
jgi:hypothetical protein